MPDDKVRMTVSIPYHHYKLLLQWGYFKCQTPATLAGNIIQARVEANRVEEIEKTLNSRAKDLGISPEELRDKILKESSVFKNKNE